MSRMPKTVSPGGVVWRVLPGSKSWLASFGDIAEVGREEGREDEWVA